MEENRGAGWPDASLEWAMRGWEERRGEGARKDWAWAAVGKESRMPAVAQGRTKQAGTVVIR